MFKSDYPFRVVKLVHHADGSVERVMVERCANKRMAFNDCYYMRRVDPLFKYDVDVLVAADGVKEVWEEWSPGSEAKIVTQNVEG